jgi:nucleotide-binding universal stress UspA family protein
MFRTIVVPLDGTPQAATALPVARTLARALEGKLVLVRVASSPEFAGEAEQYLRAVAWELGDVCVDCIARHGKPGREILLAATAVHADLIVMATHGRIGLQRVLTGSVSERVLVEASVPVLLMKPGGKRVTRVQTLVVPTDGTAGAALALGTAVGLARSSGARLELVQAIEPVPTWVYGADYGGAPVYIDPTWEAETLGAAQTYVDGIAVRLEADGLRARGSARTGKPVSVIEDVAEQVDADLIVMSTHALTGPARTLIGSTADALVRTARRPVLLVRRPGGDFDDRPAPDTQAVVAAATNS